MITSNSSPFIVGFTMVGVLLLAVAVVVHSVTGAFTGLYFFSIASFLTGFIISMMEEA